MGFTTPSRIAILVCFAVTILFDIICFSTPAWTTVSQKNGDKMQVGLVYVSGASGRQTISCDDPMSYLKSGVLENCGKVRVVQRCLLYEIYG